MRHLYACTSFLSSTLGHALDVFTMVSLPAVENTLDIMESPTTATTHGLRDRGAQLPGRAMSTESA
jgi:hypothetical protein